MSYYATLGYQYGKAGHIIRDTTGEGTISYSYDDVYNLTGITDRQGAAYSFTYDNNQNQLSAVENATNKTVSFAYNPRGMLSQSIDAHGASESFTYDGAANLTQRDDAVAGENFTTSFTHTSRNQLKSVTRGTGTSTFSYDPAGRLTGKSYPNGVITSYAYDANNRLTSQQAVKDGQTLQSFSQAYDPAGNITSLTEDGALTTSYSYDPLSRLTSENIGGYGNLGYTYDKVGNRLTLTEPKPTGGPALALSQTRVYWASWADYQSRQLSIDYKITNSGPGAAYSARVTGATATRGVYLTTAMPLGLGDIAQGTSAPLSGHTS